MTDKRTLITPTYLWLPATCIPHEVFVSRIQVTDVFVFYVFYVW